MEGLERIVREHSFFAGMKQDYTDIVTGCAKNVRFEPGDYLFREGDPADQLYLLRSGSVALEVDTGGGPVAI